MEKKKEERRKRKTKEQEKGKRNKSIQQKTPENDSKPTFWFIASFKMHFCDFWMILHDLVTLPNVKIH